MKIKNKLITFMTLLLMSSNSYSVDVNLSTTPLFLGGQAVPLVMLVMGRDHTLYYEAYNDATDLDGNGVIDEYETRYAPKSASAYYGIFDSTLCYDYDSNNKYFNPVAKANADKSCTDSHWSGDFLNYLTTARIDAVRKVLYGGQRDVDTANQTILKRTILPHDAHSWGKVYTNDMSTKTNHPFDLSKYSPFAKPSDTEQIFFASTSLTNDGSAPKLRIVKVPKTKDNKQINIWNWLSREVHVADKYIDNYSDNLNNDSSTSSTFNYDQNGIVEIKDFTVRVAACVSGYLSNDCQLYGSTYKPVGLLQKYQENMKFGLLTGSYASNLAGGVLRKKISWLSDEINNSDGTFSGVIGVIRNINKLKVVGFNYSSIQYDCGWSFANKTLTNGSCQDWGSPLAEMLYESVRYFAGLLAPSDDYKYLSSAGDDTLGLTNVTAWDDPFAAADVGTCSKPIDLVINSLTPNFDADQIPGSAFNQGNTNVTINDNNFNASTDLNTISVKEGINGGKYFIGETKGSSNEANSPTVKTVSSLSNVRGLSPDEPGKQGSFYSAAVTYFAHTHDLNPKSGDQKLMTHVVALSSPLPQIKIKAGNNTVTLVPMAKSVKGSSISGKNGDFQPTNQIVDYYVKAISETSGTFLINFEDVEEGADHDMDMLVEYSYSVSGNNVTIRTTTLYAAGGITQHAGYVISGTSKDGLYLDVGDESSGSGGDYLYDLDTPDASFDNRGKSKSQAYLKYQTPISRIFTADGNAASFLASPLWYAAKWGGFNDKNGNNISDSGEWDSLTAGQPDNYYPVTNMSNLPTLLGQAFANIAAGSKTTTALAYSSPILTTSSTAYAYKTSFNSDNWTGDLKAFQIDSNGALAANATWSASTQLDAITVANRKIFTYTNGSKVSLAAPSTVAGSTSTLSAAQITTLLTDAGLTSSDTNIQNLVNYLRGDKTNEGTDSGKFRVRNHRLGDIVDSTPVSGTSITDSRKFVMVGANDGMVHIFDAATGNEIFAYMPSIPTAVNRNSNHLSVAALAKQAYSHQFYVNGGVSLAKVTSGETTKLIAIGTLGQGGQTVYALDLTDLSSPTATTNLLWEFTDPELGYTGGTPSIVTLKDGTKAVVFGNGYNNTQADGSASTTGNASIFVVNALTGELISRLDTKVGASADPLAKSRANAMAQPVVLADNVYSSNGVRKAKGIYAGDLFGNLWKWNIDDTDSSHWAPGLGTTAAPSPIFVAKDAGDHIQPITTRPSLAMHASANGIMVLFGTGKYVESTDNTYDLPTSGTPTTFGIQSFYGIRDYKDGTGISSLISRGDLKQRVITAEIKIGDNYKRLIDTSSDMTTLPAAIDWDTKKGWYLDLSNSNAEILGTGAAAKSVNGERSVTNSSVSLQKLAFTTLIPGTDVCAGTNSGWSMELNASEGTLYVPLTKVVSLQDESTISYLTSQKSINGILSSPSKVYSNDGGTVQSLTQVVSSNGDTRTTGGDKIASKQESWKQAY
nr:PilC/PilY family type IV pilus protein [uncultured Tolumonas sp.]